MTKRTSLALLALVAALTWLGAAALNHPEALAAEAPPPVGEFKLAGAAAVDGPDVAIQWNYAEPVSGGLGSILDPPLFSFGTLQTLDFGWIKVAFGIISLEDSDGNMLAFGDVAMYVIGKGGVGQVTWNNGDVRSFGISPTGNSAGCQAPLP